MSAIHNVLPALALGADRTYQVSKYQSALQKLIPFLAIGLFIRAVCSILFSGMIDGEGAEYVRIAENVLRGIGYIGIATPGPQLFFPPLFPLMIAVWSFITRDLEAAGRLISIVMGSLIVFPVYTIARRLYSRKIAVSAAALSAIHPLLVLYSTTVYCEPTFITLILLAMSTAMRVADRPTWLNTFLMGAIYGLAYLVRPEGFVYMVVAIGLISIAIIFKPRPPRTTQFGRLFLAPLVFIAVTAPYIGWLSYHSGHLRLENKSLLNMTTAMRMLDGMPLEEAAFGVRKDTTPSGVWNQPNLAIVQASAPDFRSVTRLLAKKTKSVITESIGTVAGNPGFGSPAIFALAILGVFARPWSPRRALDQFHILVVLGLAIFAMYFTYSPADRFCLLFIPFLCIWGSAGAFQFSRWVKRSAPLFHVKPSSLSTVAKLGWTAAFTAILLPSAVYAGVAFAVSRSERPFKEIGALLGAAQPVRISATFTNVAFHANADFVWLPYCDEQTARQYLQRAGVTHVVLREDDSSSIPYLKKWWVGGIPAAHETARSVSSSGKHLKVYLLDH